MKIIQNISNESIQTHTILTEDDELEIQLRFYSIIQQWYLKVKHKDFLLDGLKLTLGVLHLRSSNKPFDFYITENSKTDLDPFKLDDFSSGRCTLYLLEREDMKIIRGGQDVI